MEPKKSCKYFKKFYEEHRNEILDGLRTYMAMTRCEQDLLMRELMLPSRAYEEYKKHVLYEQALDYASK